MPIPASGNCLSCKLNKLQKVGKLVPSLVICNMAGLSSAVPLRSENSATEYTEKRRNKKRWRIRKDWTKPSLSASPSIFFCLFLVFLWAIDETSPHRRTTKVSLVYFLSYGFCHPKFSIFFYPPSAAIRSLLYRNPNQGQCYKSNNLESIETVELYVLFKKV